MSRSTAHKLTTSLITLTDTHANLPALDAALAAIRSEGYDLLVHIGDAIVSSPFPAECLDRLLNLPDSRLLLGNSAGFSSKNAMLFVRDASHFRELDRVPETCGLECPQTCGTRPSSELRLHEPARRGTMVAEATDLEIVPAKEHR